MPHTQYISSHATAVVTRTKSRYGCLNECLKWMIDAHALRHRVSYNAKDRPSALIHCVCTLPCLNVDEFRTQAKVTFLKSHYEWDNPSTIRAHCSNANWFYFWITTASNTPSGAQGHRTIYSLSDMQLLLNHVTRVPSRFHPSYTAKIYKALNRCLLFFVSHVLHWLYEERSIFIR